MTTYLATFLLFINMLENVQTAAIWTTIGGGVIFAAGVLLSIYRDNLFTLPEHVKRRGRRVPRADVEVGPPAKKDYPWLSERLPRRSGTGSGVVQLSAQRPGQANLALWHETCRR